MKIKTILATGMLLSAFLFSGCEEDALTTDFTVTLTQDFVVAQVSDSVFVKDTLVDAADQSSDIDKYKDRIEKVSVEKATYLLTHFVGDNTHELKHGLISVSMPDGTSPKTLASLANVNLMNLLNNETELAVDAAAVDQVCTLVKDAPHSFKLHAEGTVNKTAFTFTVRVKIFLKIKAKVL
jgi:hypothetical protein